MPFDVRLYENESDFHVLNFRGLKWDWKKLHHSPIRVIKDD
jgi:hypothetical protein